MNSGLPPPAASSKKNSRYPSKNCKYAGVTFRASRDKFQARIYKGNKEYNLGLFDVAADAALAYDIAHRLVKTVTAAHGKERETLESYESEKNGPDWLDYGDEANANSGLDPEKLNFLRPLDFKVEREKELNESKIAGTPKYENCPKLEELRATVRKESIRVVKIIVGASDGGTNNYRKKGGSKKGGAELRDGSLDSSSKRKKKKRKTSTPKSPPREIFNDADKSPPVLHPGAVHPASSHSTAVGSAWAHPAGNDLYQATGMGRPVPNPSSSRMKDHPYGPPPVVPVGHMARANPQMIKHMSASTLKAMMENANEFNNFKDTDGLHSDLDKEGDDNGKAGPTKKHASTGSHDNHSPYSHDTLQAGNTSNKTPPGHGDFNYMGPMSAQASYYGAMGMGVPPGMGGNGHMHPGRGHLPNSGNTIDFSAEQSPENYRDFFRNMRNVFPHSGGPGPMMPSGMYGQSPEEYQRFMMARSMSQNAGMPNNGIGSASMGSMMGMDNHSSLHHGNVHNEMSANQKNEGHTRRLGATRGFSMSHGGPPNDIHHPGQLGSQNMRSLSPSTLNMLRAGGLSSAQGSQPSYNGSREQQCLDAGMSGMYGGDRMMNQQFHGGMHGPPYGNHPSSFGQFGGPRPEGGSRGDQQAFMQSFGRSGGFPSNGNAPGGGGGFNPSAYDDDVHAQLLRMQSRNEGSHGDKHEKRSSDPSKDYHL